MNYKRIAVLGVGFVIALLAITRILGNSSPVASEPFSAKRTQQIDIKKDYQFLGMHVGDQWALVEANGSPDGLHFYNLSIGRSEWTFNDTEEHPLAGEPLVAVSADQAIIRSGEPGGPHILYYVSLSDGEVLETFDPGGEVLAAYQQYYVVQTGENIFQLKEGEQTLFEYQFKDLKGVYFTPAGDKLMIMESNFVGGDFWISMVEVANPVVGEPIVQTTLPQMVATVVGVEAAMPIFSQDGTLVAISLVNGQGYYVFNLQTGEMAFGVVPVTKSDGSVIWMRGGYGFSPDNQYFYYLTDEGHVYIIDLATDKQVGKLTLNNERFPKHFGLAADGQHFAILGDDSVAWWELKAN